MEVVIVSLQKRSMESIVIKCMADCMNARMDGKKDGWKKDGWVDECVDRITLLL